MGLCHWWKRHDNPEDYSFARFNKRPRMVRYSKEEYDMHIKDPPGGDTETGYGGGGGGGGGGKGDGKGGGKGDGKGVARGLRQRSSPSRAPRSGPSGAFKRP